MVNPESKNLAEFYPMVGGHGAHSYAKNSSQQREVVDATKEMVKEAIADKLDFEVLGFENSTAFQVADLGCSTGPSTFVAMQNIIEAVEQKHQNPSALEFQVIFNDHHDNDFNTLFKSLPPSRKSFATAVPGSFHSRLFPNSTLHFVYSYELHWLSKVPEDIQDSESPVWNKDSIQCTGFAKEVAEVYAAQFKNDMECFLNARAEELVEGGLMVIILSALPDGIPMSKTTKGKTYDLLGSCLIDMVKTLFNFPLYCPTPKEFESIIERNGLFSIESTNILAYAAMEKTFCAEDSTSKIRAVFEGLIKEHIGSEAVDQIFNHFTTKLLAGNFLTFDDLENHNKIDQFVSLKCIHYQLI